MAATSRLQNAFIPLRRSHPGLSIPHADCKRITFGQEPIAVALRAGKAGNNDLVITPRRYVKKHSVVFRTA